MGFVSNGSSPEDQTRPFCSIPVNCAMPLPGRYLGVSETEITVLKEALRIQQKLLGKIYFELDEEREAASTAASEALSMIIRLQGEKAAIKMEADQYKRMAEEKMFHAEESLAHFEDLMYQKEMQIASLEFQIQAYRCKLLSMGCSDSIVSDKRSVDHLSMQRNGAFVGGAFANGILRGNSLPPIPFDSYYNAIDRERCAVPLSDSSSKIVEEKREMKFNALGVDNELGNSTVEYCDPYPEQIKKLDELVKVLLEGKQSDSGGTSRNFTDGLSSVSLFSQGSSCLSHDCKHCESVFETAESVDSSNSTLSVDDFFEVSQCCRNHNLLKKKEQNKVIPKSDNMLENPDSSVQEVVELNQTGELNWMKKASSFSNCICEESDGVAVDCRSDIVCPLITVAESEADFLKDDRKGSGQEVSSGEKEEANLLSEIRSPLQSLQEAMLYFWL